jgi:hypothetical protein
MSGVRVEIRLDARSADADRARERALRLLAACSSDDTTLTAGEIGRVLDELAAEPSRPDQLVIEMAHLIRAFVAIGTGTTSALAYAYEISYQEALNCVDLQAFPPQDVE